MNLQFSQIKTELKNHQLHPPALSRDAHGTSFPPWSWLVWPGRDQQEADSQGRGLLFRASTTTSGRAGRRRQGRCRWPVHHVSLGNSTPRPLCCGPDHRHFQFPQSLLRGGGDFLSAQLLTRSALLPEKTCIPQVPLQVPSGRERWASSTDPPPFSFLEAELQTSP